MLITEQPSAPVQVPTPTGIEFREKRRYTYYYLGPSQDPDTLITLEDGVVISGQGDALRTGLQPLSPRLCGASHATATRPWGRTS